MFDGTMRTLTDVSKGAPIVMKGEKTNGLYLLKGSTITGAAEWKTMIEKQTRKSIKCLRTDNGLELCQGEFNEFCKNEGIVRHQTVRYIPQHNRVVERINRTLLERARCMLSNVGLPNIFWVEAVNTACYLIFGYPTYAHVNDGKLDPRAKKCIFLGYADGTNSYRLWCPDGKSSRFLISRDVTFDEPAMLKKKEEEQVDAGEDQEFEERWS
ncbi:retrovirus-related pol polyprotein from transposon TNT 1-94 [Tanacetum coccineum]